jgi:hypothetical protein
MNKLRLNKLFSKLEGMLKKIEEYNAYLDENKYYEGYGRSNSQLSFNVKIHSYISESNVEDYIKTLQLDEERTSEILEEFNDERLNGMFYHFLEDNQQSFIEDLDNKENPYYYLLNKKDIGFYGISGGHLCLGSIDNFTLEISDTEVGHYPIWQYDRTNGSYYTFNSETLIQDFKEHFGVTTQKEVYDAIQYDIKKGDIGSYYEKAIENKKLLEKLEIEIADFKENSNKYLIEHLNNEIDMFVESQFGIDMAIQKAEQGDYSNIDNIKTIENSYLVTNRNAKVPLNEVKNIIQLLMKGYDIQNKKIGAFTINKIVKKEKDTYIKIGCHLFSLNQTLLNKTLN